MKEKGLVTALMIGGVSLLPMSKVKAQLPFFNGQRAGTSTYALENRAMLSTNSPEFKDILVGKTFRKEVPVWVYLGTSYNNEKAFSNPFYGIGPILNVENTLFTLPTLEGSGRNFTGATVYSTLKLWEGFHIDLDPNFDKSFKYNSTSFNIGKTYSGLTFGITSSIKNGKLRNLKDTDIRICKGNKGTFIDFGINSGKKILRVAFQKAF